MNTKYILSTVENPHHAIKHTFQNYDQKSDNVLFCQVYNVMLSHMGKVCQNSKKNNYKLHCKLSKGAKIRGYYFVHILS